MKLGCNLKVLIGVSLFMISFSSFSSVKKSDCMHKRNTICHKMIKLNPKMDQKEAYKLSNIFSKMAKKYDLNPALLVSIAFQESSFKPNAIRKVSGFLYDVEEKKYVKTKIGSDFCMMQIHTSNIRKMELSVEKLLDDPKYCIETGAKILSRYKKEFSKTEVNWWTNYNAKTKLKQQIYFNKVSRHLNKLDVVKAGKRELASSK